MRRRTRHRHGNGRTEEDHHQTAAAKNCNRCRDHYNVVADDAWQTDVRVTMGKLQELIELLDGKAKWDDAKPS